MARQIKEKQCWAKVRIQLDDGVITVSERKLPASLFAGLLLVGPVVFFFVVYFAAFGQSVPQDLIVVACVMAVPMLATLIIYRPPRVIRFYPNEQVAQRGRKLFHYHFATKWIDLNVGPPEVRQIRVLSKESRTDGGAVAVGCFLMILGPLGMLLSLSLSGSGRQQRVRAYAIRKAGESNFTIAVLMKQADAQKIVALYEAVSEDSPSDLISDR